MRGIGVVVAGLIMLGMAPALAQAPRPAWINTFNGEPRFSSLTVSHSLIDESGNFYLVADLFSGPVILVQKFSASGQIVWQREWRYPQGLYHTLIGAALDSSGNVNLFVKVVVSQSNPDLNRIGVVRFLPSGELLDVHSYRFPISSTIAPFGTYGTDVAFIDQAGNRYIMCMDAEGRSAGTVLVKLTPTWGLAWRRFLPAFYVGAASVDSDGGLFLIGSGYNLERPSGLFYARARLSATGSVLWQILSDIPLPPSSGFPPARPAWAAGADRFGNLYGVYPDLRVEKYAPDGSRLAQWAYSGSRPITWSAHIDAAGNLFLGGSDGSTRLVARLNPSLALGWLRNDFGTLLGGRVAIAAHPSGETWVMLPAATAWSFDVYRLAWDGSTIWTRTVRPGNFSLDAIKILVNAAGQSVGLGKVFSSEVFVVSLDVMGDLLYSQRVSQQRSPSDAARGLSLDRADNSAVLVDAGGDFQGLSYAPGGTLRWQVPALEQAGIDGADNWVTAGSWLTDSTTWSDPRAMKYAPSGQRLWDRTERLSGTQSFVSMAIAPDGSIFVGGSHIEGNAQQSFLLKLASNGQRVWHFTQPFSTTPLNEFVRATRDGGAYLLARAEPDGGTLLIRYTADGAEQWRVVVPLFLPALLTDGQDNAFVSSFVNDAEAGRSFLTIIKISPAGELLWQNRLPINSGRFAQVVAPSGDLYGAVQQPERLLAYRITPDGALRWLRGWLTIGDQVTVATDSASNFYIATSSWLDGHDGANTMVVRQLNPVGNQQWRLVSTLHPEGRTILSAIRVDSAGRVLIAGSFTRETGDTDAFVMQLRPSLPGDVNGDGCVNDADLFAVLQAFGSSAGGDADLNGDDVVDDADLLRVLFQFGNGC